MQHRIVSLIPSATEIVAALGFADNLVGRSHECDYPRRVANLTVCSEPRIDVSGTSRQIDTEVREAVREALSVYRVFEEELERLQPTLVVTQTQCDVCAVNLRDVEAAVCKLLGSRPAIVSLEPMSLADIWNDIVRVAEGLNDRARGASLVGTLQNRLHELSKRVPGASTRPTVGCIEWLDPLMIAGNWIPELVEIAGGQPVLGLAGKHSPWVSWDDLVQCNPDFLIIMPCGFGIERVLQELNLLTENDAWKQLKAVRKSRVFITDGNQYFNRPGPRVVESVEILAEILHGEAIDFGHRGKGWIASVD